MALVKCPECGNECSDKADFCPKCGYPFKKDKSTNVTNPDIYITQEVKVHIPRRTKNVIIEEYVKDYLNDGWEIVSYHEDRVAYYMDIKRAYLVTLRKKR